MAAQHEEVRAEIQRIEETYEALAYQLPVTPRATLKDDILNRLAPLEGDSSDAAQPIPTHQVRPSQGSDPSALRQPESQRKQRSLLPFQLGIAASLLIALAAAAAALYFRSQWQETEQELRETIAQNQEVASQYETASERVQRLENDLSIVASSDYQQIALSGTDVSPNSSARVYWNPSASQVYLNSGNLPVPPEDKQYQLWAIVDGTPVSAGVFDVTEGPTVPLQEMNISIAQASAFAITLEPRGGSEAPTLAAMYVQGAVADS